MHIKYCLRRPHSHPYTAFRSHTEDVTVRQPEGRPSLDRAQMLWQILTVKNCSRLGYSRITRTLLPAFGEIAGQPDNLTLRLWEIDTCLLL